MFWLRKNTFRCLNSEQVKQRDGQIPPSYTAVLTAWKETSTMMATRWQGTAKQGWESPAHFYKISREQKPKIPRGHWFELGLRVRLISKNVNVCWLYLTPAQNHKEMVCQVQWTPSNTGKVGQRNLKARYRWKLYLDLHLISDHKVNERAICLKSCSTEDGKWNASDEKQGRSMTPVSIPMGNKPESCAPTVKYTHLGWKERGKLLFCYSTDTKENSLADVD